MGSGVRADELFTSRLERSLDGRSDGRSVEVLNFGVAGYGLTNYAGVIRSKALAYQPDLIVLAVVNNDLKRPPDRNATRSFVRRPPVRSAFLRLTFLDRTLARRDTAQRRAERQARAKPRPSADERAQRSAVHVEEAWSTIRDLAASAEVPIFCIFLSARESAESIASRARFEALADTAGFGFLDTSVLFHGLPLDRYSILRHDGHPNGDANAIFALALEAALIEGDWLTE